MTTESPLQYVSDDDGNAVAVIVPIDLWREIESERETAYLLSSDAMKKRLLEAKDRAEGVSVEHVAHVFALTIAGPVHPSPL